MEYTQIKDKPIILDEGTFNGFDYVIVNFGSHPTAYVCIPQKHKFFGKGYSEIDIECHWGLTFADRSGVTDALKHKSLKNDWRIGWDYAHSGDFICGLPACIVEEGRQWTTSEIKQEVENVINQLKVTLQTGD